ncbi:hypothetical protein [Clostridium scatologenes]|uniref:Uncharacterized protein n=1 Tax=Clostridium scatologenes TaxID=1548 RepID=A0A0E3M8W3_CLOSL|nr:hypothetical protein [Clostridium scatologenes]AKA72222.1 hypothetical protein CSCA_5097 [Clostridium scatologenes]
MLTVYYSHKNYQYFLETFLEKFYIQTNQHVTLFTYESLITKLCSTDLTGIVPLIQSSYSKSNQGDPPKDAVALLRSLIVMIYTKETSISEWIKTLRSNPLLSILSGFIPVCYSTYKAEGICADPVPGVGTFYDFMDKLIRKNKSIYKSKLRKLNIAADGTCMPTQASPYGKKVCDCKLKLGK